MYKRIKYELSLLRKAFLAYRRGVKYVYYRFIVGPRIIDVSVLGRSSEREDLSMHLLCGSRDFMMSLWSLGSFYKVMPEVGKLYIHDDGSLTKKQKDTYRRQFPEVQIVKCWVDTKELLHEYPSLQQFRTTFRGFQARKLFDPLVVSQAPWLLILDSDILWFQEPTEIMNSLNGEGPQACMMQEVLVEGAEKPHVVFKDGSTTSDKHASYNSGITLYHRELFDLARANEYVENVAYQETRFTDQACYAYVLNFPAQLPADRYAIKGSIEGGLVARHYTSPSRAKLYLYGIEFITDLLK